MITDPRRIAVAFAGACAFLNLYTVQALLPLMAREFEIGATDASIILTAGTAAVAVTAPFAGAVSDLVGRKRMIVAAMALLLVPTLLAAMAGGPLELVIWRFVQGLLLPPIFTVTVAYIGDEWPPGDAAGVVGLYTACSALGGFLGRLVPGVLAADFGWRGGFVAVAAINLVCLVVVASLLRPETRFVKASNLAASLRQMLAHLKNPTLVGTYAVGFGVAFCFMATFTYVSFHLAAPPYNHSAFFLGSMFVVYLVGSALAPWVGRFIHRLGRRSFVLVALGVWAIGEVLTLLPPVSVILVGLAMCSACGILVQATSTGFVTISAPVGTSAAVGLYVTSFYIGGTIGGWLPGYAYEAGGWPAAVAIVLTMLAAMATIVVTLWREPRPGAV